MDRKALPFQDSFLLKHLFRIWYRQICQVSKSKSSPILWASRDNGGLWPQSKTKGFHKDTTHPRYALKTLKLQETQITVWSNGLYSTLYLISKQCSTVSIYNSFKSIHLFSRNLMIATESSYASQERCRKDVYIHRHKYFLQIISKMFLNLKWTFSTVVFVHKLNDI